MTADSMPPTARPAHSTKAASANKTPEAVTPSSSVSILKNKMTKLDISPETVSFTLREDGSTPDVEHKSFSVTPHPSKGIALDREPFKPLEPAELAFEDADVPSHNRNFSAELSSMEEGSTPHSLLGSSARQMSRFAFGSASPATPMPVAEEFEVYEAKVHDHGNPLFGADLTPLPPIGGASRAAGLPGSKLGSNPVVMSTESQEHSREEDSMDFGNENKPSEAAAPGPQQQEI